MATVLRKGPTGLAAVVAVALAAGSGAKAQQVQSTGCISCCVNPCCAVTLSVSASCGNGIACGGGIAFNVCGGPYGTPFYWILSPFYCCGQQFCSITWLDGQCGGVGVSELRRPRNERPYELSAAAWPVLVLDCSGQYKLVDPELAAPWGPPKAAGALGAAPAARSRGEQGSASRASQPQGGRGRWENVAASFGKVAGSTGDY